MSPKILKIGEKLMEAKKLYELAAKEAQKKNPNCEKVVALLEKAHARGEGKATYALADWHARGVFFKKNHSKALKYYRIAASKGLNADAMYNLAIAYELGWGVKQSEKRAFEYYLAAAVQKGECTGKGALIEVMRCFYYGVGVEKNRSLAKVLKAICDRDGITFGDERDEGRYFRS